MRSASISRILEPSLQGLISSQLYVFERDQYIITESLNTHDAMQLKPTSVMSDASTFKCITCDSSMRVLQEARFLESTHYKTMVASSRTLIVVMGYI